ncbi:MAG: hypothetical protein IJG53_09305, partial [Eggerthellaceae bacterium]|nr:hypothetical protein [Eggerthellaceae bacterium]
VICADLEGRHDVVPSLHETTYGYYGVKEAVFPFNMFPEVDPVLGPEMRSTGEVLGLADSFGQAYFKAQEAAGGALPTRGTVLLSVSEADKAELVEVAQLFDKAGFMILATRGTYSTLMDAGIPAALVRKMSEGRPNIVDLIINGRIDLIVNTPGHGEVSNKDGGSIRTAAIKAHIPYMTTMAAAKASAVGILEEQAIEAAAAGAVLPVKSLEEYAATRK